MLADDQVAGIAQVPPPDHHRGKGATARSVAWPKQAQRLRPMVARQHAVAGAQILDRFPAAPVASVISVPRANETHIRSASRVSSGAVSTLTSV
jgi:hypothetical protein